jgi:hypothetical protein
MKKIVFLFAGIASIAFAEIVEMPTAFLATSKKAIEAARLVTAKVKSSLLSYLPIN